MHMTRGHFFSSRFLQLSPRLPNKKPGPALSVTLIDEDNKLFSLCLGPREYLLERTHPITGLRKCVPAIERGSAEQPIPVIFGVEFMKVFTTTFDLQNQRIGFARSSSASASRAPVSCGVEGSQLPWEVSDVGLLLSGMGAGLLLFAVGVLVLRKRGGGGVVGGREGYVRKG